MKLHYPAAEEGEWIQPRLRGFRLQCCTCGVIHRLVFRVQKSTGKVQFKAFKVRRRSTVTRARR